MLKPLLESSSLKTIRRAQDKIGELMEARCHDQMVVKLHDFARFSGAWIVPSDLRRQGVILYLHGGGYTCGGMEYAQGFGSVLAVQSGASVFCAAYRLAPENPFPAAVEDALESYRYLLDKGYPAQRITLCGESAGGGLCYALCLKLKEENLPLPCGVITISPWLDLTLSGESYISNRDADPSMSRKILDQFAGNYTDCRENVLASPLLGDMQGMPPSLIFAAENEILRSDAEEMANRLTAAGGKCTLILEPNRWHGYLLYGLPEDAGSFTRINAFLNRYMAREHKLRWIRLDNAAKIYPAARNQNWSNVFRLSASLTEPIDVPVMQMALDVTVRRFPSIAVRLRRGLFWYYLQQLSQAPQIREEYSYPLTHMSRNETRHCAFRVIVYQNRVAVEFFHSLTDGSGGMIFLKSLLAEYLQQKYGLHIPAKEGVLGRLEEPKASELEDSFPKYAAPVRASRKSDTSWHMTGTPELGGFLNLICMQLPVKEVLDKAHEYGISLTAFLTAAMMQALQQLQAEKVPDRAKRKPLKVQLPVNLRNLFPSKSLRNFALYIIPEIMPKLGEYSFEEICRVVHHCMGTEITAKQMSMMIAANVDMEQMMAVKLMPLFLKNIVMKLVFLTVGERKSCLNLSNLGAVRVPEEMGVYVERMDFILAPQSTQPHNCGVLSYGDTLYLNFIRNIREPELEYCFYRVLRDLGLPVLVESNR